MAASQVVVDIYSDLRESATQTTKTTLRSHLAQVRISNRDLHCGLEEPFRSGTSTSTHFFVLVFGLMIFFVAKFVSNSERYRCARLSGIVRLGLLIYTFCCDGGRDA